MNLRKPTSHPGLRTQMARGYRPTITPTVERVELSSLINQVVCMDALEFARSLPDESINCVVTSPPYFALRNYGVPGQMGLETTDEEYIRRQVLLFREIRRVLRRDGTLWLNLGDTYTTHNDGGKNHKHNFYDPATSQENGIAIKKPSSRLPEKNLYGIPWRVALALQADGWYLRQDIIWSKPNPMPESVKDRCTKAHEYVFLLTKSERYWFDGEAIKEPVVDGEIRTTFRGGGDYVNNRSFMNHDKYKADKENKSRETVGLRNKRSVWDIATEPTPFAHFATFPQKLIEPMILAGCPVGGVVYDPFMGSGTTGIVARDLGRNYTGSELNPDYLKIAQGRLAKPYTPPLFREHQPGESPAPSQSTMFGEVGNA